MVKKFRNWLCKKICTGCLVNSDMSLVIDSLTFENEKLEVENKLLQEKLNENFF